MRASERFNLMEKQRIKVMFRDLFEQLDKSELVAAMDQQKLRTLVFEKTGVKIDVDDPVFALVALNEAVLEEAVERQVRLLDEASGVLAGQVGALAGKPAGAPVAAASALAGDKRIITIAAGAAVLGAVLVLAGQALFFRAPPAAPVVQAMELTPEQQAAIRGRRKAREDWSKRLKTGAAIEADAKT